MKIVCISDTHLAHESIDMPKGDILIHAGDISSHGSLSDITAFGMWLDSLDFKHKIVIAGNHDFSFENDDAEASRAALSNSTYLEDSGCVIDDSDCGIEGLKIWGTPWQPWFFDWAFNIHSEAARKDKWDLIPDDTDILVVHGPPNLYGDRVLDGTHVGCKALRERILSTNIKLVVTGHIHESYGEYDMEGVKVVNASIMDLQYSPMNKPIVVEL